MFEVNYLNIRDMIAQSHFRHHFFHLSFVIGLRTRMVCPNYEVVWDVTGPLLIQPGSNLGKRTTQT